MSKLTSFLFAEPTARSQYVFVVLRLAIAALWLISAVLRWVALGEGHPVANGMVRSLFGSSVVIPMTYLFTLLETLGAIALILGLATRLVAIWPVVEFAITGTFGVLNGSIPLVHDYALFAGALVLLMYGSPKLSVDGLLAKD
jgi:uncharacterized membrane protein YphA (DoxX/SURF4 family)